ncbi:CidA/LrgA family protein [Psychromonas sp. Urea-02u-13]|uniref:CidA/LrgA family protein n=1 Tax=Psychromonas sp. Urea-02u-13 TaxID=2058326 RepID=UPI000C34BEB8|nr:CidA/LrgA family protein [Psychromonas sp. Urea-02u-13]PKG37428.1 hydrogenase [Psychromonas sp. Urea-02u-13]
MSKLSSPALLTQAFNFVRGFIIIFVFLAVGKVISAQLPIVFPGSIIGLLLLFLGLTTRLIKIDWVIDSANFTLKYMVILFIPLAVGLINYLDLLVDNWIVILFSTFFSSFLIMFTVGHLFQYLNKKGSK